MNLIVFRIQSDSGRPIAGALLHGANSVFGDWNITTNNCGEVTASLTPGHYDVTISATGYKDRTIPMDLADSGIITEALESDFPVVPTRAEVCNFVIPMQGVTMVTKEFGTYPSFGIESSSLRDDDLETYCNTLHEAGCSHAMFCWSWNYSEPDYSYPVPGRDLTNNYAEIRRRLEFIIERGLKVVFFLSMDGLSNSQYTYNDPQGWTYGYEWGLISVPPLLRYLRDEGMDLTKYIIFMPGFDGVFYGWTKPESPDQQPARVANFGRVFRKELPDGYLGIEHTPGNIPVGEGAANFAIDGPMEPYDVVASEFSWSNIHNDATWQIVARLVRNYNRPSDEPSGDDPHPPFILLPNRRGERYYVAMEYKTYGWVRGITSLDEVKADREYLRNMGATNVC